MGRRCTEEIKHCKNRLPYNNCRLDSCAYTFITLSGIKGFRWSKYSRENIPKPSPKYKVGDLVRVTSEQEITRIGQDCDGTPLYELTNLGFGWGEKGMKLLSSPTNGEGE